jgi:hypothetical protein
MDRLLGHIIGLSAFVHKTNPLDALPHNYPIVTLQHLLIFCISLFLLKYPVDRLVTILDGKRKASCFARDRGIYSTELSTAISARDRRTALSDRLLP